MAGGCAEKTLYLPARSRFGGGRAAPFIVLLLRFQTFSKATLGKIACSP